MELFKFIDSIDKLISVLIHNDSDRNLLDHIMPVLREPLFSLPVYLYTIFWLLKKDSSRFWKFIFFSILLISLTDFISAQLLKPLFHRPRPLYDPYFSNFFRDIVSKGGLYSFPSSHASNHFGLAFLWCGAYHKIYGKKIYWPLVWAGLICYAQVYVGKHYLSDIIAGMLLGFLISKFTFYLYVKYENSSSQYFKGFLSRIFEI